MSLRWTPEAEEEMKKVCIPKTIVILCSVLSLSAHLQGARPKTFAERIIYLKLRFRFYMKYANEITKLGMPKSKVDQNIEIWVLKLCFVKNQARISSATRFVILRQIALNNIALRWAGCRDASYMQLHPQ